MTLVIFRKLIENFKTRKIINVMDLVQPERNPFLKTKMGNKTSNRHIINSEHSVGKFRMSISYARGNHSAS